VFYMMPLSLSFVLHILVHCRNGHTYRSLRVLVHFVELERGGGSGGVY
jgi:hypothetical protein